MRNEIILAQAVYSLRIITLNFTKGFHRQLR